VAGAPNLDPLRRTLLDRVPPRWGKPADAIWDHALRLRAVKMPDRVSRGIAAIDAAFAFEVLGPLDGDDRVAVRVEGCRRAATFERPLPVSAEALRRGDVVVHELELPLADLPPCRYLVAVTWGAGRPAVVRAF